MMTSTILCIMMLQPSTTMATRSTALLFLRIWVIMTPKKIAKTMIWTRVPVGESGKHVIGDPLHNTLDHVDLLDAFVHSLLQNQALAGTADGDSQATQHTGDGRAEEGIQQELAADFLSLTMSATLAIPAMMLNSTRGYTHTFSAGG